MTTKTYAHGMFCWNDLATTDPEGAKTFYGPLCGWTFTDHDTPYGGIYSTAQLGSGDAAGLYAMPDEMRSQGIPPVWCSYVAVEDIDATAARAAELGGGLVDGPFDLPDVGRMAVIRDPQGAMFNLWQIGRPHAGAARYDEAHGTVCWNELATTDSTAAEVFYTALFGWTAQSMPMNGHQYTSFKVGDAYCGGMLQITEEWGDVPPHWLIYIAVDDCDAATEQAAGLGGNVMKPPFDIPTVGRMSVVADPQGAVFALLRYTGSD